jgi:hypothetical protein
LNNQDFALSRLSYLRHYGVPTPVLDFTLNPFVALFFAIENIKHTPTENEIDDYLSFYIIDLNQLCLCAENFKKTEIYEVLYKGEESFDPFKAWTNTNSNIFTNLNIINQEGCLISNIQFSDSLEAVYKVYVEEYFQINNKISDEDKKTLISKKIISCYNIHKGLIPVIRQKLKEKGITKDFIYPNPNSIKDEVTDKATIEVLKRN